MQTPAFAIDGNNLVAFFGSEGIYCYDLDGNQKWSRDLGVIDISKYGIGWGYASSPAIHDDRIVIVCDDPDKTIRCGLEAFGWTGDLADFSAGHLRSKLGDSVRSCVEEPNAGCRQRLAMDCVVRHHDGR